MCSALNAGNAGRATKRANGYERFAAFASAHGVDPTMRELSDPIPLLLSYAQQYRWGFLAPKGKPVRARTPEEAVRFVGQTLKVLAKYDPRIDPDTREIDRRLTNLWKDWTQDDPPPSRVKPLPVAVLHKAQEIADRAGCLALTVTARMMWVGMFFLGRPGEYCATRDCSHFFLLKHVTLYGGGAVVPRTAPAATLTGASDVHLQFPDQKNRHKNEKIGHKASGHRYASPTVAVGAQVAHLVANGAKPTTPLCAFKDGGHWFAVTAEMITDLLRQAVRECPSSGLVPEDVSARSLRASGAMAMLCDGIDHDTTKLHGRWRSDELLTYLHTQAEPLYRDLSARMLRGGDYSFVPGTPAYEHWSQQPVGLYH